MAAKKPPGSMIRRFFRWWVMARLPLTRLVTRTVPILPMPMTAIVAGDSMIICLEVGEFAYANFLRMRPAGDDFY
jgi:hypothetical protein